MDQIFDSEHEFLDESISDKFAQYQSYSSLSY